jgi:hypothetical protein
MHSVVHTQQNWKRLANVFSALQPAMAWWKKVESW